MAKQIDVLKAVTWVQKAWIKVAPMTITNCFRKAGFPPSEYTEIENEVISNELNELMELLQLPQNNDFTDIDDNLATECSSNDITVILNNFRSELNPIKVDDVEQDDDQPEHPEIERFANYSEALR